MAEIVDAQRLPSVFTPTGRAEAEGVMSYTANPDALQRRAAMFVDKLLKGRTRAAAS